MSSFLPCRICGEPTRYQGPSLAGRVHCGKPSCREASRLLKNSKLRGNWQNVPKISEEELLLAPYLTTHGWRSQFKFVPFIPGVDAPRTYHLDFAIPEKKLCLEIDGVSHRDRANRDERKDEILKSQGWQIIRLKAEEVRYNLDETISLLNDLALETQTVEPTPEPIKTCEVCGNPMPRPPEISPLRWAERKTCSDACRIKLHAQLITGRPSPRKGIRTGDSSRWSYIPCRICGEPTKIPGTPNHPRWGKKACDKPECQAASRELRRQNQSAALRGNQRLIESTKKAWERRKTAGQESSEPLS